MGRLHLKFDGVLAEQFNPIEGPLQAILPSQWSGPHVFVRTSDAFQVLARIPRGRWGPSEVRTLWPTHHEEWSDVLAQLTVPGEIEKSWEKRNRVIVRPSSREIAAMEQAFGWPVRYLRNASELIRALNLVTLAHAQDHDLRNVIQFHYQRRREHWGVPRLSDEAWRKMAYVAADRISRGLVRDRVSVF